MSSQQLLRLLDMYADVALGTPLAPVDSIVDCRPDVTDQNLATSSVADPLGHADQTAMVPGRRLRPAVRARCVREGALDVSVLVYEYCASGIALAPYISCRREFGDDEILTLLAEEYILESVAPEEQGMNACSPSLVLWAVRAGE